MTLSADGGSALARHALQSGRADLQFLSIIESEVHLAKRFAHEGIEIIPLSPLMTSTVGIKVTSFGIVLGIPVTGGLWDAFKKIKWADAFLLNTPSAEFLGPNLVLHYAIDVSENEIRRTRAGVSKVLAEKQKHIGLLLPSVARGMAVRLGRAEQISCTGMAEKHGTFVVADGCDDAISISITPALRAAGA